MQITATSQGPRLSGDIDTLPIPMLLGLLARGMLTGQLELLGEGRTCQIGLLNGTVVGIQWTDRPPDNTPNEKDIVSALVKHVMELFSWNNGQFVFQASAEPSPSMIQPGQLPTIFMVRYGLARATNPNLLKRLFDAAFATSPVITLPSHPDLEVLGNKAKEQMDLYATPTRIHGETIDDTERQLLITCWCLSMLTFDPEPPAQQHFQHIHSRLFVPRSNSEVEHCEAPLEHTPIQMAELVLHPEKAAMLASEPLVVPDEWKLELEPPTPSEELLELSQTTDAIKHLLSNMEGWGASDLFLCEHRPPAIRLHGQVVTLPLTENTPEQFEFFFQNHLPLQAQDKFEQTGDLDIGYSLDEKRRFRLNLHRQKSKIALVARAIPTGDLSFEELQLPESITQLAELRRGLVLVTGATGSGKSTTLASLLHHINSTRQAHIITIEEPIEFIHHDQKARITQREVGSDTPSFETALRHVVRESPDVILIGEMRDRETMSVALSAALTGHLVLASLHTINATQTLQRIMSYYPEHLRYQVAMDLSLSLQGIISQRLVPSRHGKGRVLAVEMLTCTPAVTQLLREQRIDELDDLLKSSTDPSLVSFNRSLLTLFRRNQISFEVGKAYATNPDEFALSARGMETGVGAFHGPGSESPSEEIDMKILLHQVLDKGASDLHLTVGRPPILRVNGRLEPLPLYPLSEADMRLLLYSILTVRQRSNYQLNRELDFALALDNGRRFRVNAYYQKGRMATSLRAIPTQIPNPEDLEIPSQVMKLADQPQGLLLVVGPTGSGKSTTLACMIDRINASRPCRIITVEDPIEFTHESILSTVDQREVHADTKDFASALKFVLRQDPDVILIGEMRDLETISAAMTAAETGHLVLATLHTNDAVQTIDRIIDAYPSHQQSQIRSQLATSLLGVVSQRLLRKKDQQGRIAAFEIMLATPAIRHLIREGKMHQAQSTLEISKKYGMVTMDDALKTLHQTGKISLDEAVRYVNNPQTLQPNEAPSTPARLSNSTTRTGDPQRLVRSQTPPKMGAPSTSKSKPSSK